MKTVVTIPTYNEKDNIGRLINTILELKIKDLEVLVIDDNSPDGTWKIVEDIAKRNKKVHLLLRKSDKGRGRAGRAGFVQALKMGADFVVEMDADFSHNPKYIPLMLRKIDDYDIAIGSRMVKGGKDTGRGLIRRLITKFANAYIQLILGIPVKDCNSGFRCFKRTVFDKVNPKHIFSAGPAIVQELLYKCHLAGCKFVEIPIVFKDRKKGDSTLTLSNLIQGYTNVLFLKWKKINNKLKL